MFVYTIGDIITGIVLVGWLVFFGILLGRIKYREWREQRACPHDSIQERHPFPREKPHMKRKCHNCGKLFP